MKSTRASEAKLKLANFKSFKAQAIGVQSLMTGPTLNAAILFKLPKKAEFTIIAERHVSKELWY